MGACCCRGPGAAAAVDEWRAFAGAGGAAGFAAAGAAVGRRGAAPPRERGMAID